MLHFSTLKNFEYNLSGIIQSNTGILIYNKSFSVCEYHCSHEPILGQKSLMVQAPRVKYVPHQTRSPM